MGRSSGNEHQHGICEVTPIELPPSRPWQHRVICSSLYDLQVTNVVMIPEPGQYTPCDDADSCPESWTSRLVFPQCRCHVLVDDRICHWQRAHEATTLTQHLIPPPARAVTPCITTGDRHACISDGRGFRRYRGCHETVGIEPIP